MINHYTPKELKFPDFKVSTRYFFSEEENKNGHLVMTNDYFYEDKRKEKTNKSKERNKNE